MATVELDGVRKSFGTVDVIHGIDLAVSEGEFIALVGPSGCGKSTLLRMIAGLEAVDRGEVRIGGARMNEKRPRDRNIAMVFQNYALYPHMTVRQNMDLNMRIAGRSRQDREARVARAAELLEITALLERRPAQLSGGQRQRVAMGRAIVRDPAVFLFDEPLSNLDAKLRVQMRSEIKALHEAVATTSVYVTHDQIEAMTLADRVVVLSGGRIEQIGSPVDLYRAPQNLFVAGFIGSPAMNLLRGTLEEDGVRVRLAGGGSVAVPALEATPGQDVVVGLRPEDVVIDDTSDLAGEVVLVEPIGAQNQIKLRTPSGGALTLLVPWDRPIHRGERLHFSAPPARVHLFDAKSENRISSQSSIQS